MGSADGSEVAVGVGFLVLFIAACVGGAYVAEWIGWACFGLMAVGGTAWFLLAD